jgi:hypothetical protein
VIPLLTVKDDVSAPEYRRTPAVGEADSPIPKYVSTSGPLVDAPKVTVAALEIVSPEIVNPPDVLATDTRE